MSFPPCGCGRSADPPLELHVPVHECHRIPGALQEAREEIVGPAGGVGCPRALEAVGDRDEVGAAEAVGADEGYGVGVGEALWTDDKVGDAGGRFVSAK